MPSVAVHPFFTRHFKTRRFSLFEVSPIAITQCQGVNRHKAKSPAFAGPFV
jgi:hypothetical protein